VLSPDGLSLYFATNFNSITQTDLTDNFLARAPGFNLFEAIVQQPWAPLPAIHAAVRHRPESLGIPEVEKVLNSAPCEPGKAWPGAPLLFLFLTFSELLAGGGSYHQIRKRMRSSLWAIPTLFFLSLC
jgi:hypothetical protein